MDLLELESQVEALEVSHPEVFAEFQRIRLWVETCIGAEVAALGGPSVS